MSLGPLFDFCWLVLFSFKDCEMAEETITPSNVAERIQQVKVEEETFQEVKTE